VSIARCQSQKMFKVKKIKIFLKNSKWKKCSKNRRNEKKEQKKEA
jgi:hypothetical protein